MAFSALHCAVLSIGASAFLLSRKPERASLFSYSGVALALFLLSIALKIFYTVVVYPIFFTPFKHIPVPPGRSLVNGHFRQFIKTQPGVLVRGWAETVPNNGLLRFYLFGNAEKILVTGAKGLSDVLVHKSYDFEKTKQLKASISRLAGMGVLLAEGNDHKTQRKHLSPAFSYRHVKDLYPVFWSKSVEMMKGIESSIKDAPDEKKVVEIKNWASRATLDIIGLAGMDNDFGTLQEPDNTLSKQYRKTIVQPPPYVRVLQGLGLLVGPWIINSLPIQWNRSIWEGSHAIRTVCHEVIAKKKEKMEKKETMGVDILSVAMQSGGFTNENLVDQMMTFLLAGHETTATALQWTVYALCTHPDIQTRLREEIRENIPSTLIDNPSGITSTAIDSLTYLNAICNEVLRFYPPVPLTVREACRDTTIANEPIPKGTKIFLSPEVTNHSVELWGPDADEFNPARWLGPGRANTGGAENNYAHLTFIHGPRSCIGQGFAKGELACLVAAIVGRFEMQLEEPDKKLEMRGGVTVAPSDGVRARINVLEGW